MQFYSKSLFDSLKSDINYEICYCGLCFAEIYSVNIVEKKWVPKSKKNKISHWDQESTQCFIGEMVEANNIALSNLKLGVYTKQWAIVCKL